MKQPKIYFVLFSIYLLVLLILTSCSPQKRLDRLLKHHPELVHDSIVVKKIIVHDTIIIEKHIIDTTFIEGDSSEKIVKEDKKAKITYESQKDNNGKKRIHLSAECKGDTIYIHDTFPFPVHQGYLIKNVVTNEIPLLWKIVGSILFLMLIWGIVKTWGK